METIEFPKLGWVFHIDPVLAEFSIFGLHLSIRWYGVMIALGFLLAVLYAVKFAPRFGVALDPMIDVVLVSAVFSVLSARIYYILFYDGIETFWKEPLKVFRVWDGGIAIYGALIGAFVTGIWMCRVRKVNTLAMFDLASIGFLIGQCLGRWGNFFNREAFGGMTELPWRMRLWISGTYYIDVHPTFLYESLWNVAGLLLLCLAVDKVRRFDGENTCFYFLWYGIGRFWIEGLRTDSLYLFHVTLFGERVRVSQALSLVMIVLTAVILLKNRSADPARMFVNRQLDGQATVLPDRSEERPIEDGPAEADRPAKTPAEDAAGGKASAEGAAEPADGGDNG